MIQAFKHYRNWRPTPLFGFSIGLTLAAPLLLVAMPHWWPWLLAAVVVDNLLMTVAGLLPRCSWVGANWTRLPAEAAARGEIAITIDDGPDPEVTPQVLDILDRYAVKATFFCVGEKVLQQPELARQIVQRGHGLENHSMHHGYLLPFCLLGGWLRELVGAQQAIVSVTGQRPCFFRPPVGLRNPLLDPILSRLDLQLVSWTRRGFDSVENRPEVVLGKLLRNLAAGDILLLHDANAAISSNGVPVILEVLPALLETITSAGLQTVTLHQALPTSSVH